MPIEKKPRFYHQIQALRDVSGSNFPNGQIRFQFSIEGGQSWNPYLSYFRIRSQLQTVQDRTRATGNLTKGPPTLFDDIAPNIFFPDSLFQQMELYINGLCVNKQDNYCHQIAAVRRRTSPEIKNEEYRRQNFTQPDLIQRVNESVTGGGSSIMTGKMIPLSSLWVNEAVLAQTYSITNNPDGTSTITFNAVGGASNPSTKSVFSPGQCIYFLDVFNGANNVQNNYHSRKILNIPSDTTLVVKTNNGVTTITGGGGGVSNAINNASFFLNSSQPTRCGRQLDQYETVWKPAMGFFEKNTWFPAGDYEIILTPHPINSYQRYAIESFQDKTIQGSGALVNGSYNFNFINMEFYICKCMDGASPQAFDLTEIRCQAQTLNTNSLTQKQFVVNPASHKLTVAFQDNRATTDTSVSTGKFKIDPYNEEYDLQLIRLYIQYDGTTLPNPIPDPEFKENQVDFMTARYAESQLYKEHIYDSTETLESWKSRGPFYHFYWPRNDSEATQVQISQQFQNLFPANIRPQLLLFDHYKCMFTMTYDQLTGRIATIKKQRVY